MTYETANAFKIKSEIYEIFIINVHVNTFWKNQNQQIGECCYLEMNFLFTEYGRITIIASLK